MTAVSYKIYPINNLKPNTLYNSAHQVSHELNIILLFIYIVFFVKSKKSIQYVYLFIIYFLSYLFLFFSFFILCYINREKFIY